jgi:hypothetical protein
MPHLVEPALGGDDELGSPVLRVRPPLHIAELLELIHQPADDLLVAARETGQFSRADAVLVEVGEHRPVAWMQIAVSLGSQTGEELFLE